MLAVKKGEEKLSSLLLELRNGKGVSVGKEETKKSILKNKQKLISQVIFIYLPKPSRYCKSQKSSGMFLAK